METLPKTLAADATRETESYPPPPTPTCGPVPDSLSLPSYKDYPAHRPFINTLVHHRPRTHTHQSYVPSSPIKAFPETNSTVILSALRNLQEKIRRLEMEKGHAEQSLHALGKDASQTLLQNEDITPRLLNDQKGPERQRSAQSNCNQVLINHLAAAESRCLKLERQLDHMRKMLRNARTERTNLLKQQDILQKAKSAEWQSDTASQYAQFDKLERLEQEYLRLTRTQNISEMKILELEMKLQEEEYQRKLIQDKANQLQTGLEASRILLQSVSPCRSAKKSKEKKSNTKSVGCSHSVRANVQSVLSLLKRHQPHLCNSRVLSRNTNGSGTDGHPHSESSSSSSSASGEELSELLQALHEELRLMSLEHDELMRQVEDCVFEQERKELRRVQERLLLKMERKGEQISKLYKHKSQIKKLRKEANCRQSNGNEVRVSTTVSTRGHSAAAVKARPGDRSKMNLRLLRDMKALQTSLRT
ncbi:centrosomal protein of 57 kDa isoform X2 [Neolamprologus brichardi]|uniref:centrosomal protein of 57 kDa isoform X2 n=1 Tax=Neolamprologus brichardi TaxID=32507 RepID=UPI0003EBDD28|nr:centrosomal protein of 57 kDa isoform X2 [Neolamprologus brichardi]